MKSFLLLFPLVFAAEVSAQNPGFDQRFNQLEQQMENDITDIRLQRLERERAAQNRQVVVVPVRTETRPPVVYEPEAAVAAGIKPPRPPLLDSRDPANSRYNALLTERYNHALAKYNEQQSKKAADEEVKRVEKIIRETNSRPNPTAPPLRQTAEQKEIAQRAKFSNDLAFSKEEAIRLYPDAAVSTSELSRKTLEIAERLGAEKNPIILSADAPLLITEMAAKELGITPKQ